MTYFGRFRIDIEYCSLVTIERASEYGYVIIVSDSTMVLKKNNEMEGGGRNGTRHIY